MRPFLFAILYLPGCWFSDDELSAASAAILLSDLSREDWEALCAELPGDASICYADDGEEVTLRFDEDDCVESVDDGAFDYGPTCGATVGDWRTCLAAMQTEWETEQACVDIDTPESCDFMRYCDG